MAKKTKGITIVLPNGGVWHFTSAKGVWKFGK